MAQLLRCDLVTGALVGLDNLGRRSGQLNRLRIGHPVRRAHNDLIARIQHCLHRLVYRVFAADIDDNLVGAVVQAVLLPQLFGNGGPKLGDTGGGGVFRLARLE